MKVKCVGYKKDERFFTVGKVYEWYANNTMTSDRGFTYSGNMVAGDDPSKWWLSKYYTFEKVDEPEMIVEHLIRDNKTIIKLSNGKVGIAKCNPDDKFDAAIGAAVALARAYGNDPEVESKKKYREVKREAKVGEYIKIVKPLYSFEKKATY